MLDLTKFDHVTSLIEITKSWFCICWLPFSPKLKDITEKLPSEFGHSLREIHTQVETFLKHNESIKSDISSTMDSISGDQFLTHDGGDTHKQRPENARDELETTQGAASERGAHNSSKLAIAGNQESASQHSIDNGTKSPRVKCDGDGETELIEQFESGVYITYIPQSSGAKIFKRVQFR